MQIKIYSFLTTLKKEKYSEFEAQLHTAILEKKADLYRSINQIQIARTDNPKYYEFLELVSYFLKLI